MLMSISHFLPDRSTKIHFFKSIILILFIEKYNIVLIIIMQSNIDTRHSAIKTKLCTRSVGEFLI